LLFIYSHVVLNSIMK